MVAWALCCTLMGIVQNYQGLLACRAFLGIAEGGLFPGMHSQAFYYVDFIFANNIQRCNLLYNDVVP